MAFSSNFLARNVNRMGETCFFLSLVKSLQMFSGNMYIKQVAASKSNMEVVLMVGAISKEPESQGIICFSLIHLQSRMQLCV